MFLLLSIAANEEEAEHRSTIAKPAAYSSHMSDSNGRSMDGMTMRRQGSPAPVNFCITDSCPIALTKVPNASYRSALHLHYNLTSTTMKLSVFSAQPYDRRFLDAVYTTKYPSSSTEDGTTSPPPLTITYHSTPLSLETAPLAAGSHLICAFVNDTLTAPVLHALHTHGVRAILLRCAGYNNVDLPCAESLGLFVANVPAYSPEAVAEFAVALIQTLNRKTHRAYNRVREGNFMLEGLMGVTLHGRTVGIVGLGRIGLAFARIMRGFGCRLVAVDPFAKGGSFETELGGRVVELEECLRESDVVSLHCPLMESTRHVINGRTLKLMKKGAMLVNTSRGGLIDTKAVIHALKSGHLGGLALDVYEAEGTLFYRDHSGDIIQDDELMRLTTFPNVLVCGHQAFLTEEALKEISEVTFRNLDDFVAGRPCKNSLVAPMTGLTRTDSAPVRNV